MKKETQQPPVIDPRAEEIASYLREHPEFFDAHPDVLAALDLRHDSGGAVSLIERQVGALRDIADSYRAQLEDLVMVARDNEAAAKRLHRLTLALIHTRDFDEMLNILQDELRDQFNADAVELKLFSADELAAHANEPGPALFRDFMQRGKPCCGRLGREKLDYLFGAQALDTGSAALIPLNQPPIIGVLAIGSADPERFNPGKGLEFLIRLGDIISHSLQAVSTPGS